MGTKQKCDTKKNVTKMGMIINGVYYKICESDSSKKIKIVSDLSSDYRAIKLFVGSVVKTNIELIITVV
jgi:hypothetical protein